jgi:hypothetical protein
MNGCWNSSQRDHSNEMIAAKLNISENTVKAHMHNILPKIGAHDRTHAVTIAINSGGIQFGGSLQDPQAGFSKISTLGGEVMVAGGGGYFS